MSLLKFSTSMVKWRTYQSHCYTIIRIRSTSIDACKVCFRDYLARFHDCIATMRITTSGFSRMRLSNDGYCVILKF